MERSEETIPEQFVLHKANQQAIEYASIVAPNSKLHSHPSEIMLETGRGSR